VKKKTMFGFLAAVIAGELIARSVQKIWENRVMSSEEIT
jgi:hypothetical protein